MLNTLKMDLGKKERNVESLPFETRSSPKNLDIVFKLQHDICKMGFELRIFKIQKLLRYVWIEAARPTLDGIPMIRARMFRGNPLNHHRWVIKFIVFRSFFDRFVLVDGPVIFPPQWEETSSGVGCFDTTIYLTILPHWRCNIVFINQNNVHWSQVVFSGKCWI